MSTPQEILVLRFGEVLLQKKENIKIVSKQGEHESGVFSLYQALIEVGASLPVLVAVLSDPSIEKGSSLVKDLPMKALHVRSYRNWKEFEDLGFSPAQDLQTLQPLSLSEFENFKMEAVSETENSRTYQFEDPSLGSITLFSNKPKHSKFSHGLPTQTRLLGWINDFNFVFTPAK